MSEEARQHVEIYTDGGCETESRRGRLWRGVVASQEPAAEASQRRLPADLDSLPPLNRPADTFSPSVGEGKSMPPAQAWNY